MRRLDDCPLLLEFLAKLLARLRAEWTNGYSLLEGYMVGDWSMDYSRAEFVDRGVSATVTLLLTPSRKSRVFLDGGHTFNTTRGMFVLVGDQAGRLSEVEMFLWCLLPPPFFEELMVDHSASGTEDVQSMLQDARSSSVPSVDEFLQGLEEKPLIVVEMED